MHRLAGDFEAAEKSFREANVLGYEPQPGLALLRLMQGNPDAAAAAIRRAASVLPVAAEPVRGRPAPLVSTARPPWQLLHSPGRPPDGTQPPG